MPTFTTQAIAAHVRGELLGPGDVAIAGVNAMDHAKPGELTFIGDGKHAAKWGQSKASAALVTRGVEVQPGEGRCVIVVDNADLAMAAVLELFAPPLPEVAKGVHATAIVDATATVGEGCRIGPYCVIGPRAVLGAGCVLYGHVQVFDDASIGEGTVIWSGTVIRERCVLGARCIVHPNVTIGADGFGYRAGERGLVKIPQIGIVRIGDDVEIGAGTCIDRAKFAATVIGDGCKIDNLVQVAHNCVLGRCVVIAAHTAIGGSATIGDGAMIGGAAMLPDHITIGAGAKLGGGAALLEPLPPGESWVGYPARPRTTYFREQVALRRLPEALKRLGRS